MKSNTNSPQKTTSTEGVFDLVSRISDEYRNEIKAAARAYDKYPSKLRRKRIVLLIRGWVNHPVLSMGCGSSVEMMEKVNAKLKKKNRLSVDDLKSYPGECIIQTGKAVKMSWKHKEGYEDYKDYPLTYHVKVNTRYLKSIGYPSDGALAAECGFSEEVVREIMKTEDSVLSTMLAISDNLDIDIEKLTIGKPYAPESLKESRFFNHALNMEEIARRYFEKGFDDFVDFARSIGLSRAVSYKANKTGRATMYAISYIVFALDCSVSDILQKGEYFPEWKQKEIDETLEKWRTDGIS